MRNIDVTHLRKIASVLCKLKSDGEKRKGADDFPLPVNLLLSPYSFFLRNFLFAFRLSERARMARGWEGKKGEGRGERKRCASGGEMRMYEL